MGSGPNFPCERKFSPDPIFLTVLGLLPSAPDPSRRVAMGTPCAAAGLLAAFELRSRHLVRPAPAVSFVPEAYQA
jgi:hypothetical protein